MSVEAVQMVRAHPLVVAQRLHEILRDEVLKGCDPTILRAPVALEPPYRRLSADEPAERYELPAEFGGFDPPAAADLVRLQVWLAPDEPFDWHRSELFLKELAGVRHRAGLEIVGNCDQWPRMRCDRCSAAR